MRNNEFIVGAIDQAADAGSKAVLATVVAVQGSAYRREGAKLLVDEREGVIGMISGGCLEPDVAESAKGIMEHGQPMLKSYKLDEDLMWGLGLGCPGTVNIYMEPVPTNLASLPARSETPFQAWLSSVREQRECVLATILPMYGGTADGEQGRLFIARDQPPIGGFGNSDLDQSVVSIANRILREHNPKSGTHTFVLPDGSEAGVYIDVYVPPSELLIFGAGHDAVPVAQYASALGIRTSVVDPREAFNNDARFPSARRIVLSPVEYLHHLKIGPRTYVVVMNHHLERDRAALQFVLNSEAAYIGLLGPRSRRVRILDALRDEGVVFDSDQLSRLHSPIGLDIGAVSPEEIAVSIISEIVAVKNGHTGGFLHDSARIH